MTALTATNRTDMSRHPARSPMSAPLLQSPGPNRRLAALALALLGAGAQAATTLTTTVSNDYAAGTGRLLKEMVEPGDSSLCVVTVYDIDPAYGQAKGSTVRNCNGSAPVTTGAMTEAAAPTGAAVFAARGSGLGYGADRRFVTTQTNALAQTITLGNDSRFGLPTSVKDANALTTSTSYDTLGRKLLQKHADGTQLKWSYVYCKNLSIGGVAIPTPTGAATADCASVAAPEATRTAGGTLTPSHYVQTQPLQADGATANGPWTRVYYDTLGREVRTQTQGFDGTSAKTIQQDTRYHLSGQVAGRSEPYFAGDTVYWTEIQYDALGRQTSRVRQGASGPEEFTTTYAGLLTTVTDPLLRSTKTLHNAAGEIDTITDAANGTLKRRYDPAGRMVQSTDPLGNVTSITYDKKGRQTGLYDPDLGVWAYEYDALGQQTKLTDAKQQATTMAYDLLGRRTSRTAPDLTSTWYHDAYADGSACAKGIGKQCETRADNGYVRKHSYDSAGRLASTSTTADGIVYTDSTAYVAATGRTDTRTYPTGVVLKYGYTALGYLSSVKDNRDGATIWQANERDARLALTRATHGNGVVSNRSYHVDGRAKAIQAGAGNAVQNLAYEYDLAGNTIQRTDESTGVGARFDYDALNRLTTETRWSTPLGGEVVLRWAYNAIGNITSHSNEGSANTYLYNTSGAGSRRPHALAGVSGMANGVPAPQYAYDDNGNLTSGAWRTLKWTSNNLVQEVTLGAPKLAYVYGPDEQRVKEIYTVNGTAQRTTVYLNPAEGGLFFEHESGATGLKKKHYVSADGQVVAVIVCTAEPCTTVGNTATQHWHLDAQGSVVATSNAAGVVIERMGYEPFGKRRNQDGNSDPYAILSLATDRGFTGHEHMQEVDLVNMNGRVYDPALGRFLSADPTVPHPDSTQSYNRYSYTRNNPLRSVDPSGFTDVDIGPGSGYLGIDFTGFSNWFSGLWNESTSPKANTADASVAGSKADGDQRGCDANCRDARHEHDKGVERCRAAGGRDCGFLSTAAKRDGGGTFIDWAEGWATQSRHNLVAAIPFVGPDLYRAGVGDSLKDLDPVQGVIDATREAQDGQYLGAAVSAVGIVLKPVKAAKTAEKLSGEVKDVLRSEARDIWQAATGRRAIWDGLQVHHRIPLEYSHLFPKADPNRLANLIGVEASVHSQISNAWAAWGRSLNGRVPSPSDVMRQALSIDKQFGSAFTYAR